MARGKYFLKTLNLNPNSLKFCVCKPTQYQYCSYAVTLTPKTPMIMRGQLGLFNRAMASSSSVVYSDSGYR